MEASSSEKGFENSHRVKDAEDFDKLLEQAGDRLVVVHFHSKESQPSLEMIPKCQELAAAHQDVIFLLMDIEGHDDIKQAYNVSMTPTFVFLFKGAEMEVVTGANERRLEQLIIKLKK